MRFFYVLAVTILVASPASAQWTRVTEIPSVVLFDVSVNGDSIAASSDTAVFVSTNAGATWKSSARVPGISHEEIQRAMVRNGRVYAFTRGDGVFVSDDFGDTWADFNQGLVGGFADSQLAIMDMVVRGDSLYIATDGS